MILVIIKKNQTHPLKGWNFSSFEDVKKNVPQAENFKICIPKMF